MGLLAGKNYNPTTAVTKVATAATALAAFDTTNLRLTFNAPASGNVLVRVACPLVGGSATPWMPVPIFGVLSGATVIGAAIPMIGVYGQGLATQLAQAEAWFIVTGLTSGASQTWDAAWAIEQIGGTGAVLKYGGANDTTAADAAAGLAFEVYDI